MKWQGENLNYLTRWQRQPEKTHAIWLQGCVLLEKMNQRSQWKQSSPGAESSLMFSGVKGHQCPQSTGLQASRVGQEPATFAPVLDFSLQNYRQYIFYRMSCPVWAFCWGCPGNKFRGHQMKEMNKTVLVCESMYEEPWREARVNSENTLAPV